MKWLLFVCVCSFVAPAVVDAVTIDSFTDLLPSNTDLPVSGLPVVFVGTMCDGGGCPPGLLVSHLMFDAASQSGLGGVLGGDRYTEITYVAGTANAVVYGGMSFNHSAGASAVLELRYGMTVDLEANLTAYSGTRLEINVLSGDMYAGPRPVPCTITVTSSRGTPQESTASASQDLIGDGLYMYPFSSFPGVDFTDVDMISVVFDTSRVSAVDFSIGPFKTDGETVPTQPTTWGHIKSLWE